MNKERLGNFISNERKALGLTQKDLASALHVTDKAVSKWERGMSYPDVTLLEPLAAALDLTVEDCLTFTAADLDDDGVTELIVRTRWPEKPYTVYDYEDGTITEIWPDTVDEELMGGLMTDAERQAELERQLRQGA